MKYALVAVLLITLIIIVGCNIVPKDVPKDSQQQKTPHDSLLEKTADTSDLDKALEELDEAE